jgi:uncharacterized protein (TIGR02449 family)
MISEFTDLAAKIDRLADLTAALKRENAQLRQANSLLATENATFMDRLTQAQVRIEALLASLPADDEASNA